MDEHGQRDRGSVGVRGWANKNVWLFHTQWREGPEWKISSLAPDSGSKKNLVCGETQPRSTGQRRADTERERVSFGHARRTGERITGAVFSRRQARNKIYQRTLTREVGFTASRGMGARRDREGR
jgi:hypothetical protein